MLNEITQGICRALTARWPDCEVYKEHVTQGLNPPAFTVQAEDIQKIPYLKGRAKLSALYTINYFPAAAHAPRDECLEVQDQLFYVLEYITHGSAGDLIRGTDISGQIVDNVLVLSVSYSFFTHELDVGETFESLQTSRTINREG